MSIKPKVSNHFLSDSLMNQFQKHFLNIQKQLLAFFEDMNLTAPVRDALVKYYTQCLEYVCQGGKQFRGLLVPHFLSYLNPQTASDSMMDQALQIGWCIEILHSFFLVADDLMDAGTIRRGKPCWYLLPEVGYGNAINDVLFLQSVLPKLLKSCIMEHPQKEEIIDTFHRCSFLTSVGQHLDNNPVPLSEITMEQYISICHHKTSYYSFYLPSILGLRLCHIQDVETLDKVKAITLDLGEYFQVRTVGGWVM